MDLTLATQEDAQKLANRHEEQLRDRLQELLEHSIELRSMKPGALRTSMALEYAKEGRRYLDEVEASELHARTKQAYQVHKFLSAAEKKFTKPVEILLKQCADIRVDYEHERRRAIEENRRQLEAINKAQMEEQRAAEIAHLQEIGQRSQAEMLAAKPLPSVSVNVNTNAGKPEGEIMVEVWRPKRDESEEMLFTDEGSYLHWLADRPEFRHFIKHVYGKVKAWLTANRGITVPPGLEIEHTFEPRTRLNDE